MGIQGLKYLDEIIQKRAKINDLYRHLLKEVPGIRLVPTLSPTVRQNHAYMPIEGDEQQFGMNCDALYEKLKQYNVYSRRYYYPLICDYACYCNVSVKDPLSVARWERLWR